MLFTMSLALAAGDQLAAEGDALLAWASISVLIPDALLFWGIRNIAATPAARLPFAAETETNRSFHPASTHQRRMPGRQICRNPHGRRIKKREEDEKERGSNLRWSPSTVRALPGMCPKPELWARSREIAPRENLHVVRALGVLGDVEAFTLYFNGSAQADDDIDDLVQDRRADAGPHQRGANAPGLRGHLRHEVVVRHLWGDGGVVHNAGAAERRVHQNAGAERADDAADAVDAEHVERVVVAQTVL